MFPVNFYPGLIKKRSSFHTKSLLLLHKNKSFSSYSVYGLNQPGIFKLKKPNLHWELH